jgi:hypothetical protein
LPVGSFEPPAPNLVLQLMYQFLDNLNFKIDDAKSWHDHLECLTYAHYEFVRIHPFNNSFLLTHCSGTKRQHADADLQALVHWLLFVETLHQ